MDSVDQRTALFVAAGVAAGALVGYHLQGSRQSLCPWMWCGFGGGGGGGGSSGSSATKEEYISRLGLVPHPEGGFFCETYRSGSTPMASKGQTDPSGDVMQTERAPSPGERNVMTSIYYMLTRGSSHQWWANNMSDHVHYHHGGGTFIYNIVQPDGSFQVRRLGSNLAMGDEPQLVVTGGSFKSVRLDAGAEFGIIGEGVAPGFDFRDFKFVTKKELAALSAEAFSEAADLVKPDPEDSFDHFYEQ
mmetsp:Transcript_30549/g.75970  ORF Transcript_30549/g.75970 Transcript_30549/m.75970 type:complete len:246 (+) Transcript_30549:540-1277(+)